MDDETQTLSIREKAAVLWYVTRFDPRLSLLIACCSVFVALLEGIGVGFLLPILQFATPDGELAADGDTLIEFFAAAYALLGVPFTLEYVIIGVGAVLLIRYAVGVILAWLRALLQAKYVASLKSESFERTLEARLGFVEERGSDEVLNTIVTEIEYGSGVILSIVSLIEKSFLALVYLGLSLYLAPQLTILAVVVLGGLTGIVRYVIEPAYGRGSRVAAANESIQRIAQSGVQGLREVKLFDAETEIASRFDRQIDNYVDSTVTLRRNQALLRNSYEFANVLVVFALLYLALTISGLALGTIAVFLFAMYRLLPIVSSINNEFYYLEGQLPHVVRTNRLIDQLDQNREVSGGTRAVPDEFDEFAYRSVTFAHDTDGVLRDLSASIERGEFTVVVGPSGAGKSTLLALAARLYDPDRGHITADGTPIDVFSLEAWRSRVAMVTQEPYLFDDTLYRNVTLGSPETDRSAVEHACELARVDEFLDELPEGYETQLGEDGVRLSGGQKQRVAIARALLKDADLLLLDEATNDLDATLETELYEAIEHATRDRFVLAATHRLHAVTAADTIFVLEDGRITEVGTHEELRREGGTYDRLYDQQVTG